MGLQVRNGNKTRVNFEAGMGMRIKALETAENVLEIDIPVKIARPNGI